jgi:hypothetical protein
MLRSTHLRLLQKLQLRTVLKHLLLDNAADGILRRNVYPVGYDLTVLLVAR